MLQSNKRVVYVARNFDFQTYIKLYWNGKSSKLMVKKEVRLEVLLLWISKSTKVIKSAVHGN